METKLDRLSVLLLASIVVIHGKHQAPNSTQKRSIYDLSYSAVTDLKRRQFC